MKYARALVADEQYDDAEIVLETQSKLRPTDTHIWFLLAETAGLASNITGVHLARAEYFYLHGALHRAIQHLEYAQRLVRESNPLLETKLAQRIQDLRTTYGCKQLGAKFQHSIQRQLCPLGNRGIDMDSILHSIAGVT